jgi:hypothetical protein
MRGSLALEMLAEAKRACENYQNDARAPISTDQFDELGYGRANRL